MNPDTERPKSRKLKSESELEELTRPEPPEEAAPVTAQPKHEKHLVEDLILGGPTMFNNSAEVISGAAHQAGWEMTTEVTESEMKGAITNYLKTPA